MANTLQNIKKGTKTTFLHQLSDQKTLLSEQNIPPELAHLSSETKQFMMTFMTNCFQQRFAPISQPTIGLTLNDSKVTVAGTEIGNNERTLQCMSTKQVPFTPVKLPSQIGNMQLPYTPEKLPPLRDLNIIVVKDAQSPPELDKNTQKEDEDFKDMPELTPSPHTTDVTLNLMQRPTQFMTNACDTKSPIGVKEPAPNVHAKQSNPPETLQPHVPQTRAPSGVQNYMPTVTKPAIAISTNTPTPNPYVKSVIPTKPVIALDQRGGALERAQNGVRNRRTAVRKRKGGVNEQSLVRRLQSLKTFKIFVTKPVLQFCTDTNKKVFKVAIFMQGFNSKSRDNQIFEFKPAVMCKSFDIAYAEGEGLPLGSGNAYTEMVLANFLDVLYIRSVPGSTDDSAKRVGRNEKFFAEQLGGVFEIEVSSEQDLRPEIDNIIAELRLILRHQNFFEAYKYGAWAYFLNRDLADVDEVLDKMDKEMNDTNNGTRQEVFEYLDHYSGSQLYTYILKDTDEVIRQFGTEAFIIMYDVALDHVIQDKNVGLYAREMFGIYTARFADVVFTNPGSRSDSFLHTDITE